MSLPWSRIKKTKQIWIQFLRFFFNHKHKLMLSKSQFTPGFFSLNGPDVPWYTVHGVSSYGPHLFLWYIFLFSSKWDRRLIFAVTVSYHRNNRVLLFTLGPRPQRSRDQRTTEPDLPWFHLNWQPDCRHTGSVHTVTGCCWVWNRDLLTSVVCLSGSLLNMKVNVPGKKNKVCPLVVSHLSPKCKTPSYKKKRKQC